MNRLLVCCLCGLAAAGGCGVSAGEDRAKGIHEIELGRTSQAEERFRRVLDVAPSDPDALYYMGRLAQLRGDHEKAIYYYQCCLDADAGYRGVEQWLTQAQRAAGRKPGEEVIFVP